MKALKLKKLIFISFISLALFGSCKNWLTSSKPQITDSDKSSDSIAAIDAQNETAELSIQISNGKAARTVNPNNYNAERFVNFVLTGRLEGTTTEKQLFSAEGFDKIDGTSVALKCGTWELTLSAKYNGITFSDTKTIEIKRTQQNRVTFTLKPTEHFGGFEIKYDFNGGGEGVPPTAIRKVEAVLKKADGTGAETKYVRNETQIEAANNMAVFSRDITNSAERLESGSYLFTVKFYADANDPTPINTREEIICIQPGLISEAEIRLDFNAIYKITYGYIDDTNMFQSFDDSAFENATGTVIKSYSVRSQFNLPVIQVSGKIFKGWIIKGTETPISKIEKGRAEHLELVAEFEDLYYVDANGNDNNTGLSSTAPLKTLSKAIEIINTKTENKSYSIIMSGTFTNPQEIKDSNYDDNIKASSLTIMGSASGAAIQGSATASALAIDTDVPVTIKDLTITKGTGSESHGVYVASSSKIYLAGTPVINDLYVEDTGYYSVCHDGNYSNTSSLFLAENLGSDSSVTITPKDYTVPDVHDFEGISADKDLYVSVEEESNIDIANNCRYFNIAPEYDNGNPTGTEWFIDDNGCLNKYCTLTFTGEGASSMSAQKVPCTYFEPGAFTEPVREGYQFKGWYFESSTYSTTYEMKPFDFREDYYEKNYEDEDVLVQDTESTFINSDMTLHATWRCLTINTIHVNANTGDWCSENGRKISLGDGSEAYPLKTLNSAFDLIKEIDDSTKAYTITISGKTNECNLVIDNNLPLASLLLQGKTSAETDGIYSSDYSVSGIQSILLVSTPAQVTIQNMLVKQNVYIEGAYEGVVMNIGNGSTVILESGTVFEGCNYGNTDAKGAIAVENGGNLIMNEGVTVKKFSVKCGAVYVNGGTFTMNGGTFTNNESNGTCGAVYVNGGTFTMNDGYITNNSQNAFQRANALPQGAGVCVVSGSFIMEGGHITDNNSCVADGHTGMTTAGGGVFVYADGSFIMRGGEISNNHAYNRQITTAGVIEEEIDTTAQSYGGGVCLQASGSKVASFTMTGGTISGNTAGTSGNGIGFLGSPNEGVTGTINFADLALVKDNDIYLPSYATIKIIDNIAGDDDNPIKATITPQSYKVNLQILEAVETVNLESEYDYFAITKENAGTANEREWLIDSTGKLYTMGLIAKTKPDAVGDIVLKDGTVYGNLLHANEGEITDQLKSDAVAVIFYAGPVIEEENLGNRVIGLGLHTSPDLIWADTSANGYKNQTLNETSGLAYDKTNESNQDKNGSDNWDLFCSVVTDEDQASTKYPAFNWVNNYASTYSLTGDLSTGWYMPSGAELRHLIVVNSFELGLYNQLNNLIEMLGGDQIDWSQKYWSSSPAPKSGYENDPYWVMTCQGSTFTETQKSSDFPPVKALACYDFTE